MGKKKRNYVEKHKQSLGEQLENPESYGVRVGASSVNMVAWRRRRQRCGAATFSPSAFHPCPQTQPRPNKRRKGDEEDEDLAAEELVPAAMSRRILREAREQQEELDAEAAPAVAAIKLGAGQGLVAAAAKGLQDSDSEDDLSGGWERGNP